MDGFVCEEVGMEEGVTSVAASDPLCLTGWRSESGLGRVLFRGGPSEFDLSTLVIIGSVKLVEPRMALYW